MQSIVEVLAISDTHGSYRQLRQIMNHKADIFLYGGDFTYYGKQRDFIHFFQYLAALPIHNKVVISGNHQISLDNSIIDPDFKRQYLRQHPCPLSHDAIKHELSKHCLYLQHQSAVVRGVKIFGSPYTPYYGGSAFQYPMQYEQGIWSVVPQGLDILLTHGPPLNILDRNSKGVHAGSAVLRDTVRKKKPTFHVYGHIHESHGMIKIDDTIYMNVSKTPTRILIDTRKHKGQ